MKDLNEVFCDPGVLVFRDNYRRTIEATEPGATCYRDTWNQKFIKSWFSWRVQITRASCWAILFWCAASLNSFLTEVTKLKVTCGTKLTASWIYCSKCWLKPWPLQCRCTALPIEPSSQLEVENFVLLKRVVKGRITTEKDLES